MLLNSCNRSDFDELVERAKEGGVTFRPYFPDAREIGGIITYFIEAPDESGTKVVTGLMFSEASNPHPKGSIAQVTMNGALSILKQAGMMSIVNMPTWDVSGGKVQ